MSDKIRIVGSFGEQVVSQVQSFVGGLQGVSTVSVLRDGNELYSLDTQGEQGNGVSVLRDGNELYSLDTQGEQGNGEPAVTE